MQHRIFEPNGLQEEPIPANGYVRLRIEKVSAMESGRKYGIKTVISHFDWELMVRKSFPMISDQMYKEAEGRKKLEVLARQAVNAGSALRRQIQYNNLDEVLRMSDGEDEVGPSPRMAKSTAATQAKEQLIDDIKPIPFLSLHLTCAEHKERQNGWNCKANIELTVSSASKVRSRFFHEVNFSEDEPSVLNRTLTRIPWDELMAEYIGGTEEGGQDWLQICASVNIVEQNGYGLLPIKDILIVNGCTFHVNKAYLAAFSNFFRTMFFSPEANNSGIMGRNDGEHQIMDPTDNMNAFKLMLKIAIQNGEQPNDELIVDLLQLADKYDLPNVTEICEKFLLEKSKLPKIQKLGLADQYTLANLKKHSIQQIEPVEFCEMLPESVNIYNELSQSTRQELNAHMKGHKRRVRFINIGPEDGGDQPGPSSAKQSRCRTRCVRPQALAPPSSPLICIERADRLAERPDRAARRNAIIADLCARRDQLNAALQANRQPQ